MTHIRIMRNTVCGGVDFIVDDLIRGYFEQDDDARKKYNKITEDEDAQFPAVAGGNGASYRHCDT